VASAREALLEGVDLWRTYSLGSIEVPAVRGATLAVWPGELLILQGPSGSGKTTLLNLLGLLDRPDRGTVRWQGESLESADENTRSDLRRDRMGFVFQTFNLIPVLTASENVELPMLLAGVAPAERRRRAGALLEEVGLAEKSGVRPDLLSGGQRQRVALARALANGAPVLLADEPTANLDSETASDVIGLVERLRGNLGVACVVATHDPMVTRRADRVISMRDGRILGA
jgi:putative ABC transport system ATP-binding protein